MEKVTKDEDGTIRVDLEPASDESSPGEEEESDESAD